MSRGTVAWLNVPKEAIMLYFENSFFIWFFFSPSACWFYRFASGLIPASGTALDGRKRQRKVDLLSRRRENLNQISLNDSNYINFTYSKVSRSPGLWRDKKGGRCGTCSECKYGKVVFFFRISPMDNGYWSMLFKCSHIFYWLP